MTPALRWGVLGSSRIAALAVVPALRAAGQRVAVVASRSPERARRVAAELGIPRWVSPYERLLEMDLDCVYIPLPNSLHGPVTLAALDQGLHVLCEKPLAMSAPEAEAMAAASRRAGRLLAEAVMYRHHPRWRLAVEALARGEIGAPQHVAGSFAFPLSEDEDYRWHADLGGGALYDVGSYLVSAARQLFAAEPRRVSSLARLRRGVDVDCEVTLDFAEGRTALVSASFGRAEAQWLRVEGDAGSLLIPKPFTAWHGERLPLLVEPEPGAPPREIGTPAADPYQEMAEEFVRAVQGGTPLVPAEEGAANLRVLDACRGSWANGGWVNVSRPVAAT